MTHRKVGTAELPQTPAHLPRAIASGDPYPSLYAQAGADAIRLTNADQRRRIRPGTSAEEVYRRLPTAPDFEFSGYLTKTSVRYAQGRAFDCDGFHDNPCAFHTHPTEHRNADLPSLHDLYGFLRTPVRRSITVGRQWIWWWDKDRSILHAVKQLLAWESEHMVACMVKCASEAKRGANFVNSYRVMAMEPLGLREESLTGDVPEWAVVLEQALGLRTSFCRR